MCTFLGVDRWVTELPVLSITTRSFVLWPVFTVSSDSTHFGSVHDYVPDWKLRASSSCGAPEWCHPLSQVITSSISARQQSQGSHHLIYDKKYLIFRGVKDRTRWVKLNTPDMWFVRDSFSSPHRQLIFKGKMHGIFQSFFKSHSHHNFQNNGKPFWFIRWHVFFFKKFPYTYL